MSSQLLLPAGDEDNFRLAGYQPALLTTAELSFLVLA